MSQHRTLTPSTRTRRSTSRFTRLSVALALVTAACSETATGPAASSLISDLSFARASVSSFTVLGNAAATCTDGTIIGDVGTFFAAPTGDVTLTNCPVTGSVHVGDAAAVQAYEAFVARYDAMAPVPNEACTVLTGTLSGVSLAPGSYCFDAAAALTGVLTLAGPANGTWTFKIGTSGTGALTGTNFTVLMAGGAVSCNVTWWVAEAATLTDSRFIGTILAGQAITLTRGTFYGNVYSQAGVTVTGTELTGCEGGSFPPNNGGQDKDKCNQGVGNGPEGCDPGNSNHRRPTNDENGGVPGQPGRKQP